MEFFEERLLLLVEVLVLLQLDFVLPLHFLEAALIADNFALCEFKLRLDLLVLLQLFFKLFFHDLRLLQRNFNLLVFLLLLALGFASSVDVLVCFGKIVLELLDDVHVSVDDFVVVVLDVVVLLLVLLRQLFDGSVFLLLNFGNFSLTLSFHIASKNRHFVFILALNFL